MKLIVKNIFRDKTDHVTVYKAETILEVKDKDRAADLVKRGLCAEYKGKKPATVTLGEEAPEVPAEEAPEAPAEDAPEASAEESPKTPAEGEKPKSEKQ